MHGLNALRGHLLNLLSAIVFYLCFVPGGFLLRLLRQDPMQGRPDPARQSYWKKRAPHGLSDPMKHSF